MHTILGANGPVGRELARYLREKYPNEGIRLVDKVRMESMVGAEVKQLDLLSRSQTYRAVEGSQVVYMVAGLPMDGPLWRKELPAMVRNVVECCARRGIRLVYLDNSYLYPQTAEPQTEDTVPSPRYLLGEATAWAEGFVTRAIDKGRIRALIVRTPELYGPRGLDGFANKQLLMLQWFTLPADILMNTESLRTFCYMPDAVRAMHLLASTPDAYGQLWHLPCADQRLSQLAYLRLAAKVFGDFARYRVIKHQLQYSPDLDPEWLDEYGEMLPHYNVDHIFVSDKFKKRFPDFQVTSLEDGLTEVHKDYLKDPKMLAARAQVREDLGLPPLPEE